MEGWNIVRRLSFVLGKAALPTPRVTAALAFDIAIIVSTFERPGHLARCLASLAMQRGVSGRFEVVVTDDGSRDDTPALVATIAKTAPYPLTFTTHEHRGFQLARTRNEGIFASTAPYLLFTDADCVLPADHVRIHLEERRRGRVAAGDCIRLDRETSQRIDLDAVRRGSFTTLVPHRELARIRGKALRALAYGWLRIRMRPRLSGNNIAAWRDDLERINGFDEQFIGWGFEDRDLQQRLERIGVRARTVLHRTAPVHLWHPPAPSFSRNGDDTPNLAYFQAGDRPTFCRNGLVKEASESPMILGFPSADVAGRAAA